LLFFHINLSFFYAFLVINEGGDKKNFFSTKISKKINFILILPIN